MTHPPTLHKISVIGAGAWGTALATIAARAGCEVTLWALEEEVVNAINNERENTTYLRGIALHLIGNPYHYKQY